MSTRILAQREDRRIRERAGRAIVQLLFTRPDGLAVERLRQLLRDGLLQAGDHMDRAVASLRVEELLSAIVEIEPALARVGLHLEVVNGFARLLTSPIGTAPFAEVVGEDPQSHADFLTQAALEVLAAIALKEPVSFSDLTNWFDADKRSQLERLLERGLIEKVRDSASRVFFVTTGEFLRWFKLSELQQLRELTDSSALAQRTSPE